MPTVFVVSMIHTSTAMILIGILTLDGAAIIHHIGDHLIIMDTIQCGIHGTQAGIALGVIMVLMPDGMATILGTDILIMDTPIMEDITVDTMAAIMETMEITPIITEVITTMNAGRADLIQLIVEVAWPVVQLIRTTHVLKELPLISR